MPSDAFIFVVFAALQLADYELTAGILKRGGRELNPAVRWALDRFGNVGLIAWKLLACAAGYVLLAAGLTWALAALGVLYAGIVAWNWRQVRVPLRPPRNVRA